MAAHQPGSVDLPETTYVYLGAVVERAKSLQGVSSARRAKVPGCGGCQCTEGLWRTAHHPIVQMALKNHVFDNLGLLRLYDPSERLAGSNRRGTDQDVWWCRRGDAVSVPIPINSSIPAFIL